MASLYNKAVALNLERLYNKTSDFGIDYEKGCQIFTDFDKCTLGCTKIWRLHQKITEPSQKLGLTIRRKHANFQLVLTTPYALTVASCSKFSLRGVK